jgi:DNA-binding beta-propeller fold protein YncE
MLGLVPVEPRLTPVRRRRRRRSHLRLVLVGLVLVAAAGTVALWNDAPRRHARATSAPLHRPPAGHTTATAEDRVQPAHLVQRRVGTLAAPVQDAAAAPAPSARAVLLGGLTAADTSTDQVRLVSGRRDATGGRLPQALHDAAAVWLHGAAYLFGGGDRAAQLDRIVRFDPRTRRIVPLGRLPQPSSDQAAAVVAGTAYVVGGFTGSRWLDTIVAWRPGTAARVVAHLPTPLRYAAVTASDGRIVIAGGSTPDGSASDAVLAYDPGRGSVRRIGRLPAPTTHAAAASLGDLAYVIGGRGATPGTPTGRILAVDVDARRHVRPAGTLHTPLSDLAATSFGSRRILLAGGRGPAGIVASVSQLVRARERGASTDVYVADARGLLSPAVHDAKPYVYVPNSDSNTVDVIDQRTFRIVAHYGVGGLPQHVTPSYDLKTLYVDNDQGNSLTPLDPRTGRPKGAPIPVTDPYNLYFTPDGRYAIVVAERNNRLDFRDARTMKLHHSLDVPCRGVDHMDFSADGSYALASCEFSGQLVKVDVKREKVVGTLALAAGHSVPQDVKLAADGKIFYVADMGSNGLWEVDGRRLKTVGFLHTGLGVHGLYPSRDAKLLYATNRAERSISVISFAARKVVATWRIPGGGSPDMGGVSADGKVLWLSGRWNAEVYAISTRDGALLARIPVGAGPHGLCVWPQPGRYSLGHTGILR